MSGKKQCDADENEQPPQDAGDVAESIPGFLFALQNDGGDE